MIPTNILNTVKSDESSEKNLSNSVHAFLHSNIIQPQNHKYKQLKTLSTCSVELIGFLEKVIFVVELDRRLDSVLIFHNN